VSNLDGITLPPGARDRIKRQLDTHR
jgi:hypothetical protein